jgi:hypothetical protein
VEQPLTLSSLRAALVCSMNRTRRFTNPLNNLRPIEHKVPAEVKDWHRVWASVANLFAHPRYVGVQAAGDFLNRDELIGAAARRSGCGIDIRWLRAAHWILPQLDSISTRRLQSLYQRIEVSTVNHLLVADCEWFKNSLSEEFSDLPCRHAEVSGSG